MQRREQLLSQSQSKQKLSAIVGTRTYKEAFEEEEKV
jgi:hypothetical protein